MNIELKKTILSLAFIGVAFLMLDRFIGWVSDRMLERLPASASATARTNYTIRGCRAECVILGSSRANHHYDPSLLSEALGMSVYNAGSDGRGLTYSYGIFQALCSRYAPKMVVLELFYHEMNGNLNERMDILRPYYPEFPKTRRLAERIHGKKEGYKCRLSAYRYNSLLPRIFSASLLPDASDPAKGYEPLPDNGSGASLSPEEDNLRFPVDSTTLDALSELCALAKVHGIRLIGVISPELNLHRTPSGLATFFAERGIPFFDNSNPEYFMRHPELFNDMSHLNEKGAACYTEYFIRQLKENDIL